MTKQEVDTDPSGGPVEKAKEGSTEAADRRRAILDAAGDLLAEGGYGALNLRALAGRAQISLGLTYYYFAHKHAVFEALMQESQRAMADFLASFPRDRGVRALLHEMVPLADQQWLRVGRIVAVWRSERPDDREDVRAQRIAIARTQFEELRRALAECASAEGLNLRAGPEIETMVWAGLMGLADVHSHGWVEPLDQQRLTDLTVDSLIAAIVEPGSSAHNPP